MLVQVRQQSFFHQQYLLNSIPRHQHHSSPLIMSHYLQQSTAPWLAPLDRCPLAWTNHPSPHEGETQCRGNISARVPEAWKFHVFLFPPHLHSADLFSPATPSTQADFNPYPSHYPSLLRRLPATLSLKAW